MNKVYNISGIATDKAIRSTDYELLPTNLVPPSILSQIIANVYQFTWLDGDGEFKNFYPTDNNIDIVEGTEFMMSIYAIDPSNLLDVYDNSNLTYVWKRDGAPIFGINSLNNNKGLNVVYITQDNCIKDLSGTYTVEVSNAYGTTISEGFTVNIFKPLEHPMLYKNLILNSNAEQGLDNWITDNDIKTDCFERGLYENQNFGSFNFSLDQPLNQPTTQPIFRFGTGYSWNSFNQVYINVQSGSISNTYFNPNFRSSLVLNENKTYTPLASFFPDPDWIDKYNRNTRVLSLKEELESSNTYFTRDSIKFNKFGGQSSVKASQTIDLTNIADCVDGNVYGIDQLVGQLFAYVGVGLSRYKFKVPYIVDGQTLPAETNFFIYNKNVYRDLGTDLNQRGPSSIFFPEGGIDESVPIELIPFADDNTTIYLEYIDANDIVIYSKTLTGPTAEDIFAIKEKFYIPKFIEQPIENAIPYKEIEVFYVFNFANAVSRFDAWIRDSELRGVRINLLYQIEALRNTLASPQRFAGVLRDLISNSDPLSFPFINLDKVENLIDDIVSKVRDIPVIGDLIITLLNPIIEAVNNVINTLSNVSTTTLGSTPLPSELTEDIFYETFYPAATTFLKSFIYIMDQALADEDKALSASDYYSFDYLIQNKLRPTEFAAWGRQWMSNSVARRDEIDGEEQVRVSQLFAVISVWMERIFSTMDRRERAFRYTNPIKIYNQQYSTVKAIAENEDKNLQWINTNIPGLYGDSGAAGFFAIEDNQAIPIGTRKVRISFEFSNTSEAYSDQNPEVKDWVKQDIYVDLYGNTEEIKSISQAYGAPRCGITSIKYVLYPNKITTGPTYKSYLIPDSNVWYIEKDKLTQNIHNSTNNLVYNTTELNNITPISL